MMYLLTFLAGVFCGTVTLFFVLALLAVGSRYDPK